MFDPQIKVKARPSTSELGDRGGLYMWAGGIRILKCGVVLCYVLSLDDFINVILFENDWFNFVMLF